MGFGRKSLGFDSCSFLNDKLTSSTTFFFFKILLSFGCWNLTQEKETDFHKPSNDSSEVISGSRATRCSRSQGAVGKSWAGVDREGERGTEHDLRLRVPYSSARRIRFTDCISNTCVTVVLCHGGCEFTDSCQGLERSEWLTWGVSQPLPWFWGLLWSRLSITEFLLALPSLRKSRRNRATPFDKTVALFPKSTHGKSPECTFSGSAGHDQRVRGLLLQPPGTPRSSSSCPSVSPRQREEDEPQLRGTRLSHVQIISINVALT